MRNIFYSLTGIMLLLGITACSEEERYATSVVKEIQLFLDDEPWAVNTGASNKPLFIYTADGEYVANYSSLYRFQLANGSYNIISTTQSDSIPSPKNLNDIVRIRRLKQNMPFRHRWRINPRSTNRLVCVCTIVQVCFV